MAREKPKDGGTELHEIRVKYFDILEAHIVVPASKELLALRDRLQEELKNLPSTSKDREILHVDLTTQLAKVQLALDGLQGGFEQVKSLRLGDLPLASR